MNKRVIYHLICQCRISLSTTSHTTQSVEHSRTQEADKCDHDKLHLRTGVPGDIERTDLALAVHPSRGKNDASSWLAMVLTEVDWTVCRNWRAALDRPLLVDVCHSYSFSPLSHNIVFLCKLC